MNKVWQFGCRDVASVGFIRRPTLNERYELAMHLDRCRLLFVQRPNPYARKGSGTLHHSSNQASQASLRPLADKRRETETRAKKGGTNLVNYYYIIIVNNIIII